MLCFGERLATVCLQYFQRFIEIEGITILVLARPSFLQKCLGEMCGGEWSWWWWAGIGWVCCPRFFNQWYIRTRYSHIKLFINCEYLKKKSGEFFFGRTVGQGQSQGKFFVVRQRTDGSFYFALEPPVTYLQRKVHNTNKCNDENTKLFGRMIN